MVVPEPRVSLFQDNIPEAIVVEQLLATFMLLPATTSPPVTLRYGAASTVKVVPGQFTALLVMT